MSKEQPKLLPLGTRVTHFNGDAGTHGLGTIIAYNGTEPNEYLKNNFKEAVEMANKAGLLGGIIGSLYDKERCPYVVRFDPSVKPEKFKKYPKGYKDVYETDSVFAVKPDTNIFPNDDVTIMGRCWSETNNSWMPWLPSTEQEYLTLKDNADVEYCIRPPVNEAVKTEELPQLSPSDGSFVPLALSKKSVFFDFNGYYPPFGIFVEFNLLGDEGEPLGVPIRGLTAQLSNMGPLKKCETVFVSVEHEDTRVYSAREVGQWRELVDRRDFSPAMLSYLEDSSSCIYLKCKI